MIRSQARGPAPASTGPETLSIYFPDAALCATANPAGAQSQSQSAGVAVAAVAVLSLPLAAPAPHVESWPLHVRPPATTSFHFVANLATDPLAAPAALRRATSGASPDAGAAQWPPRYTRVKPPGDLVRLKDRLTYLLQPPLEILLANNCLDLPIRPFPFQFDGVAFLYPRQAALLADEMGLGKSMQTITAIRLLYHAREVRRVLLVCPKPLVTNWQREFRFWAPELPVTLIEGDQAKRRWQWAQADAAVKIANYELLRHDRAAALADGVQFDLVVLDESQRIKNASGATSQVVRSLSRTRSWALTGTPVENSPDDLVGIFEFVAPGHLHGAMKPRRMGRLAADYVLRRTKEQVLADLPPKLFRDAEVELSPEQRETYRLAEDEGVLRLTQLGDSATIQHVFELVLRLKQICNFDPASGSSAKLERLTADLEEVAASGQKALVFSQWVESLTTLAGRLKRFRPLEYHGRVPSAKRDDVLREFRENPRRHLLLLSYGAGGVGLNLQFASYVFLFDRWWNPAVEDQAVNRAHRIGAAGPVTITRFLATATIEERIEQVLREKREVFDAIFSDAPQRQHLGLTQQEIFGLFRLRCPGGPIESAA